MTGSVVTLHTGTAGPGVKSAHVDTFAARGLPPAELQPTFLFDRPELAYPDRLNCVTAFVDSHVAEGRGGRTAILAPDGTHWTYADLAAEVNRIAHALTGPLGLVPGNRVLLRAPNNPTMVACWLAATKAGARRRQHHADAARRRTRADRRQG